MAISRRALIGAFGTGVIGLSGCITDGSDGPQSTSTDSPVSSLSPTETSTSESTRTSTQRERVVKFIGTNRTASEQTVSVAISINGTSVLNDNFQFSVKGDTPIGTFEEAGEYHVTVESSEHSQEETIQIQESYLQDCNHTTGLIHLNENSIQIDAERTSKGCD